MKYSNVKYSNLYIDSVKENFARTRDTNPTIFVEFKSLLYMGIGVASVSAYIGMYIHYTFFLNFNKKYGRFVEK